MLLSATEKRSDANVHETYVGRSALVEEIL